MLGSARRADRTPRRGVPAWLPATVAATALLIGGCVSQNHTESAANSAASAKPSPFYLGADISTLSEVERRGGVYVDGDKPGDALAIFMKHGWTCFRLRIWVNPRNGVNGLEYTTALAKRIKAAGGTFMLDFHYSDWWADPQKQNKPAAWAKLDFDALVNQVESYTAHVIKTLKDAGATPDFVQVGNEITGGTLWPRRLSSGSQLLASPLGSSASAAAGMMLLSVLKIHPVRRTI